MATISSYAIETLIGTSATSLVTTESTESKFITAAVFTNTSSSSVVVTIYRLNSSTTPDSGSGGNKLVSQRIPPGEPWTCTELLSQTLSGSQKIIGIADTAGVVNANISGITDS